MSKKLLVNIIRFVGLLLLQAGVFKHIGYYNIATAFPYILFIFLLPIGLPNFILYSIAFAMGLTIDAFYDSIGIHAAACVGLAAFRIFFHNITLEADMKGSYISPIINELGFKWFFSYIFFGTVVHHIILFTLEVFSFENFLQTLLSIVMSSIFTILLILLISLLFYKHKSRLRN